MNKECIIYAIGTENYIDMCLFSIYTIINKGGYNGNFIINYCEKIDNTIKSRKEFKKNNFVLNPISEERLLGNEMYFLKYFISDGNENQYFLYLDCDIIAVKNISPIFNIIKEKDDEICCVEEIENIKISDNFHAYSKNGNFVKTSFPGLNSGTFGFTFGTKQMLSDVINLQRKDYVIKGSCSDQPAFNKIIHEKWKFNVTIKKYVCLNPDKEKTSNDTTLVHFNGDIGRGERKLKLMKEKYGK